MSSLLDSDAAADPKEPGASFSASVSRPGAVTGTAKSHALLWAVAALAALTAVRLAIAAAVPLSPDEAYYWVWSQALAPGYLDHPPMVALLIRLGTWLGGEGPLGVRLLGPIATALGSLMIWDAARLLTGRTDAGFAAAALVNAMPVFAIGAVVMTPDTPLVLFWTATLWALVRLVVTGATRWWLAAGLFSGLAMASKYTAAVLVVGVVFWVIIAAPGNCDGRLLTPLQRLRRGASLRCYSGMPSTAGPALPSKASAWAHGSRRAQVNFSPSWSARSWGWRRR